MMQETLLPGVTIVTPRWFRDSRGAFCETYNQNTWQNLSLTENFVQDNHSISHQTGTIRGLHFQRPPQGQAKLVRVVAGAIWDVAVDIRRKSPTYGQWIGVDLTAENGRQLFIPEGLLHGFITRSPETQVIYKCSSVYAPTHEDAVRFNDPELDINWGISADDVMLSDKDAAAGSFADLDSPFTYNGKGAEA
jgi:dTDP-4-dehydrorhamnose 3,5-epimerase